MESYYVGGNLPQNLYKIKGATYPHDTAFVYSFQTDAYGLKVKTPATNIGDTGLKGSTSPTWSTSYNVPWSTTNNYACSSSSVTSTTLGVSLTATTTVVSGGCIQNIDPVAGFP